ncbi:porin [Psittacicella gerlachiana]|uniref:Porin n=1 Tax=Psittacicella gerlachiana TaxID=2028574 RepID=A0A3A1YCL1_9GAMM|nr:porin [Psittacicella gerlachiana]RIY35281.1 hypothetical protein CKF59_03830 [Psittacicella gerlachiana]
MKKTLLTLALAGLAGSAFANTTVYQSDVARLYVDGNLRYVYANEQTKTDNSKYTAKGSLARYRVAFGGDFRVADSTAFGFKLRVQNNFWRHVSRTNLSPLKTETQYFVFDRAFVYLANDNFGKLSLGRQATVVDGAADSDLEFLDFDTALRANLRTTGNKVAYWTSPTFGNFVFEYSYANTDYNRKLYSSLTGQVVQNAFAGTYAFSTGTVVKATFALENARNSSGYYATKKKAAEVAVVQQVGDLTLAGAYDYVRVQLKDGAATQTTTSTNTHHSVVVKGLYNFNQFFQPYAGVTYQSLKVPSLSVKNDIWGGYLGVQSDVFKYDSLNVRVFAEAVYLHTTAKGTGSNSGTESKVKAPAYAAGVKVSF